MLLRMLQEQLLLLQLKQLTARACTAQLGITLASVVPANSGALARSSGVPSILTLQSIAGGVAQTLGGINQCISMQGGARISLQLYLRPIIWSDRCC